jgi:Mlc titration factor MtfA (ptsG expression regulator)
MQPMAAAEFSNAWLAAAFALLGVAAAAWLLSQPWWAERRRRSRRAQALPARWRAILRRRVPYVARLPDPLRWRLHEHLQVFLAEKVFVGCQGQRIDDEVRVTIAAQACLLLLGQDGGACYPSLRQVLVYPEAFVVPRRSVLPGGVVADGREARAGESWSQGQVVLAWTEVLAGAADPGDGRNVVLHEFAHQVDQDGREADGRPWRRDAGELARFAAAMDEGLARLRLEGSDVLDDHAASDAAEFFAGATEAFFERPAALAEHMPAVYAELARLYGVDPRRW